MRRLMAHRCGDVLADAAACDERRHGVAEPDFCMSFVQQMQKDFLADGDAEVFPSGIE